MPDRFAAAADVLAGACGSRFTAAVARVEHGGALVFERAFGTTRSGSLGRPVYVDTRFDLASISKVFVATAALRLADRGILNLDVPLASAIVPEWRATEREAVTVRMLLSHTAGFHSGADYRTLLNRDVASFAMHGPLAGLPGERVIYSDLGFIALGVVLERAAGASLTAVVRDAFGDEALGFGPHEAQRALIPATEEDAWRGRVQGVVHDEKAYLMNGVSGHAGLFGTAASVMAMTCVYLNAAMGRPASMLAAETARFAIREAAYDPVLRRGLGWALKTNDDNSCGARFSVDSFGHTGFVGTCVWADPQRDLAGVLLTNTVYFGRGDSRSLRAAFYDAVAEAVDRA